MLVDAKIAFEKVVESATVLYEKSEAQSIAFWLLEDTFSVLRTDVLANKKVAIPSEKLEEVCLRVAAGEPVQYITQRAYFGELVLKVNPDVLIPRPETEELAHWISDSYKNQVGVNILDIGTGSGCLAIWLAQQLDQATVWAVDISEEALSVARENALRYQVAVNFLQMDVLKADNVRFPLTFDVIVSNPPYVLPSEKIAMRKNVLDYEPHLALFVPQNNPLLFYERILQQAKAWLVYNGEVFFEINEQFGKEVSQLFEKYGYSFVVLKEDFFGKPRMIRGKLNKL